MKLLLPVLLLLVFFLSAAPVFSQQESASDLFEQNVRESRYLQRLEEREARKEKEETRRKKKFKGYAAFKDDFKQICQYAQMDGRMLELYALLEPHQDKDPKCEACRPLFKDFAKACKPKKLKKKRPKPSPSPIEEAEDEAEGEEVEATPEPSPTPTPRQREPRIEILDLSSSVVNAVFAQESQRLNHLRAFLRLKIVLTKTPGMKPGARDYFGIMSAFLFAPFQEFENFLTWEEERKARTEDLDRYFFRRRPSSEALDEVFVPQGEIGSLNDDSEDSEEE